MDIVSKHSEVNDMVVYRSLSFPERAAVIAYYARENASTSQRNTAIDVVNEVKQQNAWIQCDCRLDKVALLFPRLTHSGLVTLVRPCPLRQIPHSDSCLFYFPANESMSGQGETKSPEFNYCLLSTEKPKKQITAPNSSLSYSTCDNGVPSLTSVLLRLLRQADFFRLSNNHYPSFKHLSIKIMEIARGQSLWPNSPLNLSNVLLTDVKKRVPFFYRLRNEKGFDSGHRKQGYLLVQVQQVRGNTLVCLDGTELEVTGSIDIQGPKDADGFIALILCAESRQGNGFFVCYRASLLSVYTSNMLFFVPSNNFQLLLKRLVAWRQYWREKEYDFELYYPLPCETQFSMESDIVISDSETGKEITISTDKKTSATLYFEPEQSVRQFNVDVSKGLWASE